MLVGDGYKPVGGIPGVGLRAVINQVAVGIVLVAGLARAMDLIEFVDGKGGAVTSLIGHSSTGGGAGKSIAFHKATNQ
ncbi:hypothetical protein [Halothiobacillus neapolitanus]|uniref:hypothetical protein n=1 Tax=Halothiobacillus neapolitanus TaxID=927 RepID=UPI00105BEA9D|nr:hypothetical protein [Halothiobacillus neapolitanus]